MVDVAKEINIEPPILFHLMSMAKLKGLLVKQSLMI